MIQNWEGQKHLAVMTKKKKHLKAFLAEFPEAVNFQCFRHFRKTIEQRLGKWKNNDGNEVYTSELFSYN